MKSLNASEIIDILREEISGPSELAYKGNFKDLYPRLGNIEIMEQYGGYDMGSDWWKVFYFEDHDVYLQLTGWYQSYDGVYFEGGISACVKEVKPATKTIRYWKPI